MQSLLSVLCVLVTCGPGQAWYNRYDNAVYGGGWAPDRRSLSVKACVGKNERCMKSYQCCPDDDGRPQICMIENKFGFGECKPSNKILDVYPEAAAKAGFKKSGTECKDSIECADQCCRLIRMGRMGFKQKCSKPFGDACVGRVFSPNDVMSFYD